ncbi:MAG: hypothetical protein JHC22_04735 [Thermoproteus sp.]|jgi:uncharacterized membrane protein YeaQ/YmgE (transglycosylase-associated protein family)|nr:hypothetical protein [Thermoproteus sp.]
MPKIGERVYRYYYYAYIGFALGTAAFYLYATLGGYITPNFSVGGTSLNLAELVAAIFGATTIVALYLRYVEERAKTAVSQPQKPARGAPKRRRRAS